MYEMHQNCLKHIENAVKWKMVFIKEKQSKWQIHEYYGSMSILVDARHSSIYFSIDPTNYEASQDAHPTKKWNV